MSLEAYKILVVDDNEGVAMMVKTALLIEGADVITAADGETGLALFNEHKPDLVFLDIMLPGMNGLEVCRRMQSDSEIPIILLTALTHEQDEIRGLESGAIDYITKPFNIDVLRARARAALRHANRKPTDTKVRRLRDTYLSVDLDARRVFVQGSLVRLTRTEYKMLEFLVQHHGEVLTFSDILYNVWGAEYVDSVEYVHVYASRLRQKLEKEPKSPRYLQTEYGIGYSFVMPELTSTSIVTS